MTTFFDLCVVEFYRLTVTTKNKTWFYGKYNSYYIMAQVLLNF